MPIHDAYAPGTPCWVDLATSDPAAARSFYTELMGWEADVDPRPEAGGYAQFTRDGHALAGCGPLFVEGMPPMWSTYIASADADATATLATEAGGTVMVPPMDVLDAGRMCVVSGPDGAAVGVWQAGTHQGSALVNEPGAWAWSMLATRDRAASDAFYAAVFGWEAATDPNWGDHWKLNGEPIANPLEMGSNFPPQVPPHWQVLFMVADAEACVAQAVDLGGSVHGPVRDMAMGGRMAAIVDPQGSAFGVMSFPPST